MALVSRIHYEAAATASSILKAEAMNGQGLYIVCSVSISSMTCRKGTALSARVHIKKSLIKKNYDQEKVTPMDIRSLTDWRRPAAGLQR
jgi:hypothetical protein